MRTPLVAVAAPRRGVPSRAPHVRPGSAGTDLSSPLEGKDPVSRRETASGFADVVACGGDDSDSSV